MDGLDDLTLEFSAQIFLWTTDKTAWHFIRLPEEEADLVRFFCQARYEHKRSRGFQAIKVEVSINETKWQTSIFPDKAHHSFILPLKKSVRDAQGLEANQQVRLTMRLL